MSLDSEGFCNLKSNSPVDVHYQSHDSQYFVKTSYNDTFSNDNYYNTVYNQYLVDEFTHNQPVTKPVNACDENTNVSNVKVDLICDDNTDILNLKIGFLNVRGLKTRLKFHEFDEYVNTYDIVCFSETFIKEDEFEEPLKDDVSIPGYRLVHKPRKSDSSQPSGGVCIAVKHELLPFISPVECESKDLLLCKLSKNLFKTSQDVYLGCAYISPQGSDYSSYACFQDVEDEVVKMFSETNNILLLGDFNAHTQNKLDFIETECTDTDFITANDNELLETVEQTLTNLDLPLNRITEDHSRLNDWGKYLLELCRNTQMIICNGRFGATSTKCTSTWDTVIDYIICSPNILQCISCMNVLEFHPLLSDVHKPIDVSIKGFRNYTTGIDETTQHNNKPNRYRVGPWDQSKGDEFKLNIDAENIIMINSCIDNFNGNDEKQEQVNRILNKISTMFINSGYKTFGKKTINPRNSNTRKRTKEEDTKPWYNTICRNKRVIFNKARKKFQITKSKKDAEYMKKVGAEYRREVLLSHTTYADNIRMEVRKLRSKGNKQEYWKYCKGKQSNLSNLNVDFEKFTDFFKDLNKDNTNQDDNELLHNANDTRRNEDLDKDITELEIKESIARLKNNKACGTDSIANEYIKSSSNLLMPMYVKLFNLIYNSGIIPQSWTSGIIKPIYKKKGKTDDPDNYRPITILSCLGKLFTSILNIRLTKYLDKNKIMGEEQIGFRDGYSTIDGVFILHSLTELLKTRKSSLLCAFIDLKKCFSKIWRNGLWYKLYHLNIGSKLMNVISSLYKNVKSCLMMHCNDPNGNVFCNISDMFPCENGLREGENLSPLLFSLYVNDLSEFLERKQRKGVKVQYYDTNDLHFYMKMLLLMYADDTVLFASNVKDLKLSLNAYSEYCSKWKLEVNTTKTKILNFGRKKKNEFTLNNETIEIVDSFKYLGVVFSKNGRFIEAMEDNIEKAKKGMHSLRSASAEKNIPIDCQIDLFEKTIEPILLYGAEIWGQENVEIIEKFRLKVLKQILGVRRTTPTYMVYGETGKLPLKTTIKKRIIQFWYNIVTGKTDKLAFQLYKIMFQDYSRGTAKYKWLETIETILNDTGFSHVWLEQKTDLLGNKEIKQRITDQGIQNIESKCRNSNKGKGYLSLKTSWNTEHYLSVLESKKTKTLIKFRTANHKFPVETGRYRQIPLIERKCPFCVNMVGDEYHYLLECSKFENIRNKYIDKKYHVRPSMHKYVSLIQSKNREELQNLCVFINIAMNKFK